MDRRTTPANGRVAAAFLQGKVAAEAYSEGTPARVSVPIADLLRTPGGPRDRQLVCGDSVTVYETRGDMCFVQAARDGYVGYLRRDAIADQDRATHWVAIPSGHVYTAPDIKSPERHPIYFGAQLDIVAHMPQFYETASGGFVRKPALRPLDQRFADPVTVAQLFYGAPYLWGGNSVAGLDCSGLIQLSHLACDIACPGDSDQQETALGAPLAPDVPMQRGDLLFWRGHVALAVDRDTIIHANAHTMSVAYEAADQAIHRIASQGDGPVTSRSRVSRPRE